MTSMLSPINPEHSLLPNQVQGARLARIFEDNAWGAVHGRECFTKRIAAIANPPGFGKTFVALGLIAQDCFLQRDSINGNTFQGVRRVILPASVIIVHPAVLSQWTNTCAAHFSKFISVYPVQFHTDVPSLQTLKALRVAAEAGTEAGTESGTDTRAEISAPRSVVYIVSAGMCAAFQRRVHEFIKTFGKVNPGEFRNMMRTENFAFFGYGHVRSCQAQLAPFLFRRVMIDDAHILKPRELPPAAAIWLLTAFVRKALSSLINTTRSACARLRNILSQSAEDGIEFIGNPNANTFAIPVVQVTCAAFPLNAQGLCNAEALHMIIDGNLPFAMQQFGIRVFYAVAHLVKDLAYIPSLRLSAETHAHQLALAAMQKTKSLNTKKYAKYQAEATRAELQCEVAQRRIDTILSRVYERMAAPFCTCCYSDEPVQSIWAVARCCQTLYCVQCVHSWITCNNKQVCPSCRMRCGLCDFELVFNTNTCNDKPSKTSVTSNTAIQSEHDYKRDCNTEIEIDYESDSDSESDSNSKSVKSRSKGNIKVEYCSDEDEMYEDNNTNGKDSSTRENNEVIERIAINSQILYEVEHKLPPLETAAAIARKISDIAERRCLIFVTLAENFSNQFGKTIVLNALGNHVRAVFANANNAKELVLASTAWGRILASNASQAAVMCIFCAPGVDCPGIKFDGITDIAYCGPVDLFSLSVPIASWNGKCQPNTPLMWTCFT